MRESYKEKIKDKEQEKKLRNILKEKLKNHLRNMTLKEFYKRSQNQIRINFSCINMETQTLQTISYLTRPHMPVWAALVATCSLP